MNKQFLTIEETIAAFDTLAVSNTMKQNGHKWSFSKEGMRFPTPEEVKEMCLSLLEDVEVEPLENGETHFECGGIIATRFNNGKYALTYTDEG